MCFGETRCFRKKSVNCPANDFHFYHWCGCSVFLKILQALHLGGLIPRCVQRTRQAEMCTQAWCKFHEVLGTFPAIARLSATRELNTVHLCEAPGAFITSLNHFLVCRGTPFVCNSAVVSHSLACR